MAQPRKEIVSSRSFGMTTATFDDLAQAVSLYVTRAAEKLRQQHRCTMKADNRSKKFTTCWHELPTANAN